MKKYNFHKQKLSSQTILLQALFLIGLLLMGKADPMAVVFAYVFETIIIGVFHFFKLLIIAVNSKTKEISAKLMEYFLSFFFLIHYGGFVAIQSIFIYIAFAIKDNRFSTSLNLSNFTDLIYLEGFKIIALSIIFTHLVSFFISFLSIKKYQNTSIEAYMMKPYIRIFIQQFLAIVPLFFLYFTNQVGIVAAILLIVMRAFLDFYFYYIAQSPERIEKLANVLLAKNNPQELPKIKETLKEFFEE